MPLDYTPYSPLLLDKKTLHTIFVHEIENCSSGMDTLTGPGGVIVASGSPVGSGVCSLEHVFSVCADRFNVLHGAEVQEVGRSVYLVVELFRVG